MSRGPGMQNVLIRPWTCYGSRVTVLADVQNTTGARTPRDRNGTTCCTPHTHAIDIITSRRHPFDILLPLLVADFFLSSDAAFFSACSCCCCCFLPPSAATGCFCCNGGFLSLTAFSPPPPLPFSVALPPFLALPLNTTFSLMIIVSLVLTSELRRRRNDPLKKPRFLGVGVVVVVVAFPSILLPLSTSTGGDTPPPPFVMVINRSPGNEADRGNTISEREMYLPGRFFTAELSSDDAATRPADGDSRVRDRDSCCSRVI